MPSATPSSSGSWAYSAWLKHESPPRVLRCPDEQPALGFYPTETLKQDIRRFGVLFLNPCVDRGTVDVRARQQLSWCRPVARQGRGQGVGPAYRGRSWSGAGHPAAPKTWRAGWVWSCWPFCPWRGLPRRVSDPATIQVTDGAKLLRRSGRCPLGGVSSPGTRPQSEAFVILHLERALGLEQDASSWNWAAWDANQ